MQEQHAEQTLNEVQELTRLLVINPERDIRKAAAIYAKLVEKNPHAAEYVKEQVPFKHWGRLEAVAMGALDPRLFYDFSIGACAVRQMPLSVQKDVIDAGVNVVVGPKEHLLVQVQNLTREQAYQVFDTRNKCIRSEGAQRALLESMKQVKQNSPPTSPDYEWVGDKLRINKAMTPNEILMIIANHK
jgi:hypothetical protein